MSRKCVAVRLCQAETLTGGQLKAVAGLKKDEKLLRILSEKDCVALEVKYHKCCYKNYVRSYYAKASSQFSQSYKEFCNVYIDKKIILEKKVYTMKSLLQKFKKIVKNVELTEAPCYKSERLRNRLENDFPNLEFHRPSFRRNSYIVYVREYTPGDIMEQGDFNISESDSGSDSESDCCVSNSDAAYRNYGEHSLKEIYTTALSLRNKIQEMTTFFENWPPTSTDFSMEKVKSFIPPLLFNFLAWVTNKSEDPETEIYVKLPTSDEHSILSIAQDLVYCTHRGRKPTPKAMALGMAVRQLTGSEKLINLLSGLGHCVSHSSVLRLDSSLAEISVFANSELPQNVITGKFATIVVDNADFAEEVKKQTHITNMILIQNTDSSRISSREVSLKRNFRKSIDAPEIKIPSFNLGKKETPKFIDICNYQAFVWKSCLSHFIPNVNVNDHGWIVTDDLISINWKTRNVAGDLLFQSVFCKCKTGCKKMQCVCRKNKMNCSLMCQCLSCENKKPVDNKPGESSDELDSCSDESDIGSDIEFSIEENIFE